MLIETRAAAPFYKNGFVIGCDDTREAIFIDPGDEVSDLLAIVENRRLTVRLILLTHAHVDHVSGVARAKRATGARVGVHRDDLFLYTAAVQQGLSIGYGLEEPPPPDFFLAEDEPCGFGTCEVRVHHTPGHSPGGVCFRTVRPGTGETHLFVGDTLFAGSIGRADLSGGNYETLIASIRNVLFALGDSSIVHPGHGPDTTIRLERETNPFLQD
jgi:hydroxyacylglutathione hydrolase